MGDFSENELKQFKEGFVTRLNHPDLDVRTKVITCKSFHDFFIEVHLYKIIRYSEIGITSVEADPFTEKKAIAFYSDLLSPSEWEWVNGLNFSPGEGEMDKIVRILQSSNTTTTARIQHPRGTSYLFFENLISDQLNDNSRFLKVGSKSFLEPKLFLQHLGNETYVALLPEQMTQDFVGTSDEYLYSFCLENNLAGTSRFGEIFFFNRHDLKYSRVNVCEYLGQLGSWVDTSPDFISLLQEDSFIYRTSLASRRVISRLKEEWTSCKAVINFRTNNCLEFSSDTSVESLE